MASDGQGQAEGQDWRHQYMREKNTFLEPIEEPNEQGGATIRRQRSEPSLSSISSDDVRTSTNSPFNGSEARQRSTPEQSEETARHHIVFDSSESSSMAAGMAEESRHSWERPAAAAGSGGTSGIGGRAVGAVGASSTVWSQEGGGGASAGGEESVPSAVLSPTGYLRARSWACMVQAAMRPQDLREVTEKVLRNDQGELTSLGSEDHHCGKCIPCALTGMPMGCPSGIFCEHCHFPHEQGNSVGTMHPQTTNREYERARSWARELQAALAQDEFRMMVAHMLRDDQGELLSLGSESHRSGVCTPCALVGTPMGCPSGIFCERCHYTHEQGDPMGAKSLPSSKQDRFMRMMQGAMRGPPPTGADGVAGGVDRAEHERRGGGGGASPAGGRGPTKISL